MRRYSVPRAEWRMPRAGQEHGVTGFIPSLEAYSYVAQGPDGGESWLVGRRMRPFGLDALGEGRMPYRSLMARVQRCAFHEFSRDPQLAYEEFERRLGKHVFGADATTQNLADLIELQRIWTYESDWYWQSPLLDAAFFRQRTARLAWPREKRAEYASNLQRLQQIATRYAHSAVPAEQEMAHLANFVITSWGTATPLD